MAFSSQDTWPGPSTRSQNGEESEDESQISMQSNQPEHFDAHYYWDLQKTIELNNTLNRQEMMSIRKELDEMRALADHRNGRPSPPDWGGEPHDRGDLGGFTAGPIRYFVPGPPPQTPQEREMERVKGELKKRTADLEMHQREVKRLQRHMQTLVNNNDILQSDRQKLTEANSRLYYKLFNARKQLEMKALADIRGKDSISISALKEKVVALNDEIFQAAASLGKNIFHQAHELSKEDANGMYNKVVQLIGEPISLMIVEEGQKPNAEANPLLAQVVLQVFMTKFCASKIELWVPNDPKISDFFEAVYMNIQGTEEPAVSGTWRALTQTHTRPVTVGWKEDLVSSLMQIIKIAAWKTPDKEQRLSFEGKLVPIFKAVEDLRIAIGEKITSADIKLSLVPPNSQLAVEWMDDAFADARVKAVAGGPIQCVIGTTGFGLKKVTTGERGPSGELMFQSVLSPKVILESTLKDALNPPPLPPKPARERKVPMGGRSVAEPNSRRGQ